MRPDFYYLKPIRTYLFFSLLLLASQVQSQDLIRNIGNQARQFGGNIGRRSNTGSNGVDSIHHRNKMEDSITISYRILDSNKVYKLDSSVSDLTRRFPVSGTSITLGNLGTATRSLLFSPVLHAGFDPGFHAFDAYRLAPEQVRFFNTTRPYSELNYFLGARSEQMIEILHTQNIKANWNIAFTYKLTNSPGFFKNQKSNHNNYSFASAFQSVNKRYNNYFMVVSNKLQCGENGGIIDTINYLDNKYYKDRFNIPVKLGGDEAFSTNFFNNKLTTGNKYSDLNIVMRQQYDLGKKDSLVTDSTVLPLFYPSLRFEHQLSFSQSKYIFEDGAPDSAYYQYYYDTTIAKSVRFFQLKDQWKILSNDFSIYQFPDARNLKQYIRLGLLVQNLSGTFNSGSKSFFNTAGHAEYRNKTRNQRWDMEAAGKLYFTGLNAGDYEAHLSLEQRSRKLGILHLAFENVSRTPSFIFDTRSSFYFSQPLQSFKKENTTHLQAAYSLPQIRFSLTGHYYLLTNYTYLNGYTGFEQESTIFHVMGINLLKTIRLGKHWNWHAEIYLQQVLGNGPVHLPGLYTRNRIAYEGNLGFKNLDIAMGLEARYRADYKADSYSPLLGRFYNQDTVTIHNKLPDITAYVHFRIRPFKFFIHAENLNSARNLGGFGFTNNNLVAAGYPMPGLQFRLGIWWNFVN